MKRFCLLLTVLLSAIVSSTAMPAYNKPVKVQQPDGTYVTIRLHGDEWLHFNTTADGYTVVKDDSGYYRYAELKDGRLAATAQVAHDLGERSAQEHAFLTSVRKYQVPEMSKTIRAMKDREVEARVQTLAAHQARRAGSNRAAVFDYSQFKGLIILVEYKDQAFSREDYKEVFTDMVNKEDYTGYSNTGYGRYTGSVRDYYSDNSGGKFQPQFDIVGPVKINYSKLDANGTENGETLAKAAVDAADELVNFADYDTDGDGKVDMVYFVYAGLSSNYEGNDAGLLWPYAFDFTYYNDLTKDGKRLARYACSTELLGSASSSILDGIGTICHEFSHVLGLPDFYDTDYEKSGGESLHPGDWSVMSGGSYLNYSRTPAGYSLYERYAVGFYDEPEVIDAEGAYELEPLCLNGKGYRINTPVNKEFFLFENRQKSAFKWDRYLPGNGMLVHRVDQTRTDVWTYTNSVNANPKRNYYEIVRAGGDGHNSNGSAYDVFPGSARVTALHNNTEPANLKTWSGKKTKWGLTNIKMANGVITFDVGNTYVVSSVSLPETANVGVGLSTQLTAVVEPDYAEYTLTWSSQDETIATVDKDGVVKGVKVGETDITVKTNNDLTATCHVTVEDLEIPEVGVDGFKTLEDGQEVLLKLTNAEVLYVYENDSYIRDAEGGAFMFKNADLGLKKNDRLNGTVYVKVKHENKMIQAEGVGASTNSGGLTINKSTEVKPVEVKLENLSELDYSEYVVLRAVQLERNNGVWVLDHDKRILLGNPFALQGFGMMNFKDKYYDVEAIYGTDIQNGEVIDELYRVKALVEVPAPEDVSGIEVIGTETTSADATYFNLQGQRVSPNTKGILIRNGRMVVNK